jgi:hypothetical protein
MLKVERERERGSSILNLKWRWVYFRDFEQTISHLALGGVLLTSGLQMKSEFCSRILFESVVK